MLNDWDNYLLTKRYTDTWQIQGQSGSKVDPYSKWVNGEGEMVNLDPLRR